MAYYEQGQYECRIVAQGFDESKEKKTPCFWLRFVPEKYDGGELSESFEREVKLWLTDGTIERVIQTLRGLGWEGSDFAELEPGGGHDFEGVEVTLRCMHDQDGDKVYENWEFPGSSIANSENKAGMSKKLNALFGKKLKNGSAKKPKSKSIDEEIAAVQGEDDIPF